MLGCALAFLFIALLDGFEGFRGCDGPAKTTGFLSAALFLMSIISAFLGP